MKAIYLNDLDNKAYVVESRQGQTSLKFLQELVDGLIECVSIDPYTDMWLNEEGLYRSDFYINEWATSLARYPYGLVGPAVITGQSNGETTEASERQISQVLSRNPNIYSVDEITKMRAEQVEAMGVLA